METAISILVVSVFIGLFAFLCFEDDIKSYWNTYIKEPEATTQNAIINKA